MSYKEGVIREGPHAIPLESGMRHPGFDPKDWEGGRYADILGMVRRGATNDEIMAAYSGVDESLCEVYRKIFNGTTADLGGTGAQKSMSNGARRRLYMLELSAAGFSTEEIAQKTGASMRTVREAIFGSQERTR